MRRITCALSTVRLVSACGLAACGGASGGSTLSTAAAMHSLKAAGFGGLVLNRDNEFAGEPVIESVVQRTTRSTRSRLLPLVELENWGSDASAKKLWTRPGAHGSRYVRALYRGTVAGGHVVVPRNFHFSVRRAFSARVCNVIVWSYNARGDRRLAARLERAIHLLRSDCN